MKNLQLHATNWARERWRRCKEKEGDALARAGILFPELKAKKEGEAPRQADLPRWPSLKVATLEEWRAALREIAPLASRVTQWLGDPDRLRLRYFQLSCVRSLSQL